jgi:colanic acid biosynthesis glycosyl transferase WcaI
MRIAVLGSNFHPEPVGISVYTTEMCEFLKEAGHEVIVFTAFPYYPKWSILPEYRNKLYQKEVHNGVLIRRSYIYVPLNVTAVTRILHELSFILSSFINIILSRNIDLLIVISPPLGLGITGYLISRIKKIPFIFHVQDLQPDAAAELKIIRNKKVLKILYYFERFIYSKALKIGVISKKMGEKISLKGVSKEKIIYFPNWVDTEFFKSLHKNSNFLNENGLNNKFVVLYSGNIGIKQGLEIILEIAKLAESFKDIIFIMAGDGAYKAVLLKKYQEMKLNNVKFLPVQSKDNYLNMLSSADVVLIPQKKEVTDIVMPSKLLAIMSCAKAVIVGANINSELYNVITVSKCGVAVKPENANEMFNAVIDIYKNKGKSDEFGNNGRKYAIANYLKNTILENFNNYLKRI